MLNFLSLNWRKNAVQEGQGRGSDLRPGLRMHALAYDHGCQQQASGC